MKCSENLTPFKLLVKSQPGSPTMKIWNKQRLLQHVITILPYEDIQGELSDSQDLWVQGNFCCSLTVMLKQYFHGEYLQWVLGATWW